MVSMLLHAFDSTSFHAMKKRQFFLFRIKAVHLLLVLMMLIMKSINEKKTPRIQSDELNLTKQETV